MYVTMRADNHCLCSDDTKLSTITSRQKFNSRFSFFSTRDFQNDDQQSEIVFPSSLTTNEVNFLVEEAKKSGLFCIMPSKKVSYTL